MKEILFLFNRSSNQLFTHYKKLQTIVLILVAFDLLDNVIQNNVLPSMSLDVVKSLYPVISFLLAIYFSLVLYKKLCEIVFNKKITVTRKLYMRYLWTNILIAIGSITGLLLLLIPGILWLIFTAFAQTIVIKEELSAKKSISKSYKIVRKNLKVVFYLGIFATLLGIPILYNLAYSIYTIFNNGDPYNYFSVWRIFIVFYSLFIGILLSLTVINLYKKLK